MTSAKTVRELMSYSLWVNCVLTPMSMSRARNQGMLSLGLHLEIITTKTGHTSSCCDVAGKLRLRSGRKPGRRTWSERPTGEQQQNGNNRCSL